ncbi:hypothetical protein [Paenibacillus eucommiae]|uniref:Copper export protein n=1 Tax=Paenibacillus eucommiae TaxID=1355755 RepID=A0ABS4IVK7_9BACL|nr:hypothetical protein [Paenibacillus eucommiae]MBP1991120.1 putative copper export protein [Paenibacillus eucommiae]
MFGIMLFLHLTGLFIWLGALLAIIVMLSMLKKQLGSQETNTLAKRIIRVFSMLAHPSAVVVLISGVLMLLEMDLGSDRPLWLILMERGGGTIILLALILTGILGSKAKKSLSAGQGVDVRLSGYLTALVSFMVLIVSVVLIVSMKI